MIGRFGLLFAVAAAMVLACAGIVLAQPSGSEGRARPSPPLPRAQGPDGEVVPGRYIVVLKDHRSGAQGMRGRERKAEAQRAADELAREGKVEDVTHAYGSVLKGFAAEISQDDVDDVRSDPRVEFVVQDREIHATAQTLPYGVDRVDADQSSTKAGDGTGVVDVDIAVLDSGIYRHPDLNVAGGKDCQPRDGKNTFSDDNGHGTHVAGIAAAKDDGAGVVGVAPGARLWAVKIHNSKGFGFVSNYVCGIDWVTENASTIEVANMSAGGGVILIDDADDGNCGNSGRSSTDPLVMADIKFADLTHQAICRSVDAGVTHVVAAGNDSRAASKHVPAAFDEVITVSAISDYDGKPGGNAPQNCYLQYTLPADDEFADFSNYGPDVDIAAPGECIRSTWKPKKGADFKAISGTSMAAPHVAGAAALYSASHPTASPAEVQAALVSTANTEGPGADTHTNPWSWSHDEPVLLTHNY